MKRLFLIHGWLPKPAEHWFPWLVEELKKIGVEVHRLEMPNASQPDLLEWIQAIDREVGVPDKETYIVAYSLGAFATLSYLSQLTKGKLGGIILVGAILKLEWYKKVHLWLYRYSKVIRFLEGKLDWKMISQNAGSVRLIHGTDDPTADIGNSRYINSKLGGLFFPIVGGKHLGQWAGYSKFPFLMQTIETMIRN